MIIGNWKFTAGALACAPRRFPISILQSSIFNLLSLLCLAALTHSSAQTARIEQGTLLITAPATKTVQVFASGSPQPLFGTLTSEKDIIRFQPTVPFVKGAIYHVEIGDHTRLQVTVEENNPQRPSVSLSPAARKVPANTLKLYLDFTQPMEQGVFLDRIKLKRIQGEEVGGAFRETELWSPDGKRLTLMLHPGRQKTGVNLNVDEGPVLIPKGIYYLTLSGRWRSVNGEPLGKDTTFGFMATAADHSQPDPAKWQLTAPKAGSREPLQIITDELFEPQIFQRALKLNLAGTAQTELLPTDLISWTFTPEKPWQPGRHEINIDPELEDLAGNSIAKPFEIDLTAPKPVAKTTRLHFHLP
jgi:hypothetical protein